MGLFAVRIIQHRPRKRLKVGVVQFAAGLPRRNCTKIKKRPKKNIRAMGDKQRSGQAKRSTLFPEGRGQGVGGKRKRKRKKRKKEKEGNETKKEKRC